MTYSSGKIKRMERKLFYYEKEAKVTRIRFNEFYEIQLKT